MSGGFGILLAVLLFWDEQNIVPWALLACFIHEVGHVITIRLLGGEIESFRLSVVGAEIVPTRSRLFSYREELLIAAAGPLFSIVVALMGAALAGGFFVSDTVFLFSGLNLAAGIFNLIPVGPLDGGKMLKILLLKRVSFTEAEQIYRFFTAIISSVLFTLGMVQLLKLGGTITLPLTAFWLLAGVRQTHA